MPYILRLVRRAASNGSRAAWPGAAVMAVGATIAIAAHAGHGNAVRHGGRQHTEASWRACECSMALKRSAHSLPQPRPLRSALTTTRAGAARSRGRQRCGRAQHQFGPTRTNVAGNRGRGPWACVINRCRLGQLVDSRSSPCHWPPTFDGAPSQLLRHPPWAPAS